MPDCSQINGLIRATNKNSAQLAKLRDEMDALGFGTAMQLNIVAKLYSFINVLAPLPPKTVITITDFVGCNDTVLANLDLDGLKGLVRAMVAHAELVIACIPAEKDRTDDQKKLLKAFQVWQMELSFIVAGFPTVGKDQLVMQIKAAKQKIKAAQPKVLEALVEVFSEELAKQIAAILMSKAGLKDLTDNKTLLKTLAEKVAISALGKAAAKKVAPYIDIALTGWELLVELAGAAEAKDLRQYIDQLLVKLVTLMKSCGWKWPQNVGTDPDGNTVGGYFIFGAIYKRATVVARPFIRCSKLVNGKYTFSDPCPVMFTTGPTVTAKLTDANFNNKEKRWEVLATIDTNSVQKAPCLTNGYCYAYLELTITLDDKDKSVVVLNVPCGVQAP